MECFTIIKALYNNYKLKYGALVMLFIFIGVWHAISLLVTLIGAIFRYIVVCEANLKKKFSIDGKESWAVVTGGSYGLGASYGLELAKKGFNVCLIARSIDKMNSVAEKCKAYGVRVHTIAFDFNTIYDHCNELLQKLNELGDISIIVNNAGVFPNSKFEEMKWDVLFSLISVNLLAPTLLSHYACNIKRTKPVGLVNISSISSVGFDVYSVYSATKAYLLYLTKAIAVEMPTKRVVPMCVVLGGVLTNIRPFKESLDLFSDEAAHSHLKSLGKFTVTNGHWKHYICYLAILLSDLLRITCKIGKGIYEQNKKYYENNIK